MEAVTVKETKNEVKNEQQTEKPAFAPEPLKATPPGSIRWSGICSIDCETTGLQYYWHELCEIAVVPLFDDFSVNTNIEPFHTAVRPEHFDRIEPEALKVNGKTMEELQESPERSATVADFVNWFYKAISSYKLKVIAPLGHNWGGFDKGFVSAWLDPTFQHVKSRGGALGAFFHYHGRDSMVAAQYINDRVVQRMGNNHTIPFRYTSLGKLAETLGIETPAAHTALGDALTTAAVYKKLSQI